MKKFLLLTILAVALIISIISSNKSNQAIGQCSYQNAERSGCCSHHGGVCGCVKGHAKCCDGSSSTCGCY